MIRETRSQQIAAELLHRAHHGPADTLAEAVCALALAVCALVLTVLFFSL